MAEGEEKMSGIPEPGLMEFYQDETNDFSVSCIPSEYSRNINGTVHGGVILLLCEEAIARYIVRKGRKGAAAEVHIHYYRPAGVGERITATVTERKVGRKLGIYLIEVRNNAGVLLADTVTTIAFFE